MLGWRPGSIAGTTVSSVTVNGSLLTATVRTAMGPGWGVVVLRGVVTGELGALELQKL